MSRLLLLGCEKRKCQARDLRIAHHNVVRGTKAMPPSREPPPPCFYRWRECGFVDVYQYVVTVRPLDEADRGLRPTERWQFEPDEYAVDVALRHGKHTHAGHSSVGSKMRMLEQDQGIALSVREYLALLRVGLRDGSPVPDDNGALWAPGGVTIEVAELEGEKHERKQNRELTVKVRNVADGTDLSFTLYARYAGEGYEPMNPTRCTLGVEPLNSADATSRALRAASRRERDAVDALRNGAEALRNAVAFVDAHLGGGTRGVGGNDGNIGFETSRNNSLAGGTPTKTNTGPPPGLKRFRLGLEESASRMAGTRRVSQIPPYMFAHTPTRRDYYLCRLSARNYSLTLRKTDTLFYLS